MVVGLADPAVGEQLLDAMVEIVIPAVRAIKANTAAKRLQDEFYAASPAPGIPQ